MKKLILILFLITSCETEDNCEIKKMELINRYEILFEDAKENTTQLELLNLELQRKLRNACD